jgi:MOSC domain-containing protein YiiM
MKLLSVNVGPPRQVEWRGRIVSTGIFKSPVEGRVRLRTLNLDGDKQVDLTVHGGPDRAVYAYPSEHYDFWRAELNQPELPWGSFGENFTTAGLIEDAVHVGDQFRIGTALLTVTQPRLPCYKLGIRLNNAGLVNRFLQTDRSGFYMGSSRKAKSRPATKSKSSRATNGKSRSSNCVGSICLRKIRPTSVAP